MSSGKWWAYCLGLNVLTKLIEDYQKCFSGENIIFIITGSVLNKAHLITCPDRLLLYLFDAKTLSEPMRVCCLLDPLGSLNCNTSFHIRNNEFENVVANWQQFCLGLNVHVKITVKRENNVFENRGKSEGFISCDRPWKLKWDSKRFSARLTLKFVSWPWKTIGNLFHAPDSYVSFHRNPWIQAGVVIRKLSNQSRIVDFSAPMTLKFDGRPRKLIGHLFCATSSFVHNFVAIC